MVLEELLIKIKTVQDLGGLDKLSSKLKSTEAVTKSASSNMKNNLNQVNNIRFDGLGNKFKSTIMAMAGYAKSGAKNIGNSLKDMVSSTEGALAGIAAGLGTKELFEKSMQKSITRFQLGEMSGGTLRFSDWERFSAKSSTSDDDIAKMLRYTYQGPANQTYAALNAVDAASYHADPIQRKEGLRGYGTYLQGGWTAAAGMMRDEGLTPEQKKMLQGANTYEERIAAMNSIAESKKTMVNGESLSTIQSGEIGKYNKSLAAYDGIIRGATSTFDSFLAAIEPAISWFNDLGQPVKDVIGGFLTVAAVGLTLASGLGILLTVLSPVGGLLKTVGGKLADWTGIKKPSWLGGKDSKTINTPKVTVNGKVVTVDDGPGSTGGYNKGLWRIADMGLPVVSSAAAVWATTQGLPLASRLGSLGMSLGTSGMSGLSGLSGSVLGPAILGLSENRTPDKPGTGSLLSGNWALKTDRFSKAFPTDWADTSKKGSLADQMNLPGFIQGQLKGVKIPNLRWPTADDILGFITHKFPKLPKLRWPTWNQILNYIKKVFPKLARLRWPSWNQIFSYIKKVFPKIPTLRWPSPGSIRDMIQGAINRASGSGGGGGQAMAGGDRKSMIEDASLSKGNVYINIDNIPNKSVADYTAQVLAKHLSGVNDSKGR